MAGLRELFIERLLREIFLKKGTGFVLKGGGAVRALFGEQRLTKDVDLDFTNPKRTAASLHNTLRRAIRGAARGLPIEALAVTAPGKGELSPRWKINFRDRNGTAVHVEVEVSRDARRAVPGEVVQQRFLPTPDGSIARFWVDVYDESALAATKLAALLGREAPRDVYDLDLLMDTALPSTEQIRWAIERAGIADRDPLRVLDDHLEALTWDRYVTDLRDALPETIAERIDEAEWLAMKRRVAEYAEDLLTRHTEEAS